VIENNYWMPEMKAQFSEVSIDQLARLARDAGVSSQQELPEKLQALLHGRRASDKAVYECSEMRIISKVLGLIKF
jgi:hypothetical protein